MRRPARILFNVALSGSILCFVATIALLVRNRPLNLGARTSVSFYDGDLAVWFDSPGRSPRHVFDAFALSAEEDFSFTVFRLRRIQWRYGPDSPVWAYLPSDARAAAGPRGVVITRKYEFVNALVWLLGTFAIVPAIAIIQRWRRTARSRLRSDHNLCTSCGYDLRVTPDRCPECGTRTGYH